MNEKYNQLNCEENLSYKERRSIDLVHQVLNKNSNMYQENNNISDLFKFYGKTLSIRTSKEFSDSMKKTWDIFKNTQNRIVAFKSLKQDRVNSFLIMPLKAYNHMFAAVIRRKGDDYSFTIVNKGYRMPNRSKYEEFIVPKSNINQILKVIENGMGEFAVESFYTEFEKYSSEKYKLNIVSKNQKSGNCFIKEPETAIKFAYATRNFSENDFKIVRQNDLSNIFIPKWGVPTSDMHKLFVKEVQKDNPNATVQLEGKLQIYLQNKSYRGYLKKGKDNIQSFQDAFYPLNKSILSNNEDPCIKLLANVNMDTIRQHTPKIHALVKKTGSQELYKTFFTLLELSTNEDIDIYFDRRENFSELTKKISDIEKYFPIFADEVKREFHLYYLIKSNGLFENKKDCEKALSYAQKANNLYPYNARAHFYEGYYTSVAAKNAQKANNPNCTSLYQKAIHSFSESIRLKPDIGDSYLLRGRMYEQSGKTELANHDFKNATKFGCVIVGHGEIRDPVSQLHNMRNNDICISR